MKNRHLFGKYTLFLLFVSAFIFTSCKKNKADDEKEPTKKELLSNKWKVIDVQDANGTSYINYPVEQIKCLKDNIFTLSSDDAYTIDEGLIVCDPSTASSGSWSLIENETKLQFNPSAGDPLIFTLVDITTTTLKISYMLTDIPLPGTYTLILQKQ